jgi:hypothetical protein
VSLKKTPAYGGERTKKTPDLIVSRQGLSNGVLHFFSESLWLSKCAKLANLIRNQPVLDDAGLPAILRLRLASNTPTRAAVPLKAASGCAGRRGALRGGLAAGLWPAGSQTRRCVSNTFLLTKC